MFLQMVQNVPRERVTEEFIRERIRRLAEAVDEVIGDEELEALARELEHICDVHMGAGNTVRLPYQPWLAARRASIDPFYWNRYRALLASKGFGPQVLPQVDLVTEETLDLLEDPQKEGQWERRGLVMGYVQSGKTANYIGLICKAADAGYRIVGLLAGLHNNLRRQTQERIEEGFTGFRAARVGSNAPGEDIWVGVGRLDRSRRPVSLTSTTGDFTAQTAGALGIELRVLNEPVILVVKKNARILRSLIDWLRHNNLPVGDRIHASPMLLIDDEADNASINTNADAQAVTRINSLIRELLNLFNKRCYVGYTATPFANIFIDPDSSDAMIGADLFPRHFIKSLDAPSNYVGPQVVFGDDESLNIVRSITDHAAYLPLSHNVVWQVSGLPGSLLHALRMFVLAKAVRLARGQDDAHNSMLVNVSRFMAVQGQVRNLIHEYLESLRRSILFSHRLPVAEALASREMLAVHGSWELEYRDCGSTWEDVQTRLHDAIAPIRVVEVNTRNPTAGLDYQAHEPHGLNVVAVGGLSLSRGLTLEGLTVSYFLRNTMMYDTLMQMGRWFGYREGYSDLCRIFMTDDARSWYAYVADVVEELRTEFRNMEAARQTPEDFGLVVRSHPDSLIVTARNKMRHAETVTRAVSLAGRLVETAVLDSRSSAIASNRQLLMEFIARLEARAPAVRTQQMRNWMWRDVDRDTVATFVGRFMNHPAAFTTQREPLLGFILNREEPVLELWDVALYSKTGEEDGVSSTTVGPYRIGLQERGCVLATGGEPPALLVSGSKRRVASRGAEREGLSAEQLKAAEDAFSEVGGTKNIPDRFYRSRRTRPLLMLHVIKPTVEGGEEMGPTVAYGISFPGLGARPLRMVEYVVNTIWLRQEFHDDPDDEGIDGER
jgi:hypothetical protein